jgi:polyisoprenyl-teichoic acid--peptidoglycan teichoic acid transferase
LEGVAIGVLMPKLVIFAILRRNFMQENQTQYTNPQLAPKKRRGLLPTIFWILVLASILFIAVFISKAYGLTSKVFVNNISFVKRIGSVIDGSSLIGESEGQINILVLGYGGPEHDGPYLTDSIIIVSIKPETKEVLLSTLPRDYLWDEYPVVSKINTAYSSGYFKNGDHAEAGQTALEAVEEATGLKIPYFASVDFAGFEKAVDTLGGLDIYVDNTFVDPIFPNDETKGYLGPLTFKQGWETMNGKRALQFARSRHAVGIEASDFARSRRQAKIIQAFKDKALELNLVSNSDKVNDLLVILSDHFHTNLEPGELIHLGKLMKSGEAKLMSQSLDEATGLVCGGFKGEVEEQRQYVLVPCADVTKADIKNFFKYGFEYAALRGEQTSVILEQGGSNTELYNSIKEKLTQAGITVYEVIYKGLPIQKSALYTVEEFPATEDYLEKLLKTSSQPLPSQLKASSDFVIIVGEEE